MYGTGGMLMLLPAPIDGANGFYIIADDGTPNYYYGVTGGTGVL